MKMRCTTCAAVIARLPSMYGTVSSSSGWCVQLYNLAFILLVMPPWMLYNFYLFPEFEHSCSCTTQDHTHMDDLMNKCATTLLLHYSIPKISHMRSSPPIWVQLPAPNMVNGNIQKALGMPRGQTTESTFQYSHL